MFNVAHINVATTGNVVRPNMRLLGGGVPALHGPGLRV
jgi:hypothetical protein